MKKLICILLLLFTLTAAMIGCGDSEGDPTPTPTPDSTPDNTPDTTPSTTPEEEEKKEETQKYTVKWIDEKGNCILTESVIENSVPSYTYTVTDTAEWDYTFIGWSVSAEGEALSSIPAATKDATYYARVTAVKQKYTVSFNSNGGSAVESQSVEYGAKASAPENPTYASHKFMGWSVSSTEIIPVDFDKVITENTEYFAIWNEVVDIKALLSTLLDGYKVNPKSYIPEAMLPSYEDNLVNADDIVNAYSSFVNVSDISYGYGEQWHMILENLDQTTLFFNALSSVEAVSAASVSAFNNYFDKNPDNTASYEFESGIYNVTINFDGEVIYYVLDYTATLPALGAQTVQIALAMNAESGEKTVRIQLGDANALTYKVLENSYEFAIKYLGLRTAMFSIERDESGAVSGKIYEHLSVSSAKISSAAEFYITDKYVSVVGNKADGMIGFTGCITELYDVTSGKMLGYEIQESLSSIVYNTLWFNLDTVSGINTIKSASDGEKTYFFVNGSSDEWEAKKVGGLSKKTLSRRFDIEYRTQYVYSYDSTAQEYTEHEILVPMIFVQEEFYESFVSDVENTNNVTLSLLLSDSDFDKLLSDYDTLIPAFTETKDAVTPEIIIAYIKDKITFE